MPDRGNRTERGVPKVEVDAEHAAELADLYKHRARLLLPRQLGVADRFDGCGQADILHSVQQHIRRLEAMTDRETVEYAKALA